MEILGSFFWKCQEVRPMFLFSLLVFSLTTGGGDLDTADYFRPTLILTPWMELRETIIHKYKTCLMESVSQTVMVTFNYELLQFTLGILYVGINKTDLPLYSRNIDTIYEQASLHIGL